MSLALCASPYDTNGIENGTHNLISRKRFNQNHNKTQKYNYNRDRDRDRDNNISNNTSEKVRNLIRSIHENNDIDGVDMGDFTPISPPNSAGVERTIDRSSNLKENYTGINDNYDDNNNTNTNTKNNSSAYNQPTSSNLNSPQNPNPPSSYYTIPTSTSSQPNATNVSGNDVNASNYLDSMEKNNLTYNYSNDKEVEEYYKKYVPNYNYGTVTNMNRNIKPNNNNNNSFPSSAYNSPSQNFSPYSPSFNSSTENSVLIDKLNYMIHLLEEQHDERTANVTEEVVLYCFLGVFMIFIVDSFTRVGKYVR